MKQIPMRSTWIRIALLALTAGVAVYLCGRAYVGKDPTTFYLSLIAFAASLSLLVHNIGLKAVPGLATAGRTLVVLAVLLPAVDYGFRRSQIEVAAAAPVEPAYSFFAAKGNPAAFKAWWKYYTNEWTRPDGGWHAMQMPDPKGMLPFVMMPNSSARFFESVIRMNNFGFRGADIEFDKGDRYRIFALGESSTFGATIRPDDRPWPDVLATMIKSRLRCERPIEVINAGTGGYTLEHNIERVRRDIAPLRPDLVLSYHGLNGMRFLDIDPAAAEAQQAPRRGDGPSALIEEVLYRAKLYRWKKSPAPVGTFSEDEVLRSRYAELYRELVRIGRKNNFQVVLANFSIAVVEQSPREVVEFYGLLSSGPHDIVARIAAHNYMIEKIAAQERVPVIDTTANLAGAWDEDIFLDLVHFTQKGRDRLAERMFAGLAPILRKDDSLRCTERK
jgi:lysophospholipase L1-like esterase